MLPEMVLFFPLSPCLSGTCFIYVSSFPTWHFKGTAFQLLLAWLEFVSKVYCCLVCVHFRQNIPFGQECLSFCLRSNASCSNCCFKEHYKKISLKGCQSSRFTQTRANTTTKSTADGLFDFLKRTKANIVQTFIFAMNWRRRRTSQGAGTQVDLPTKVSINGTCIFLCQMTWGSMFTKVILLRMDRAC